MFILPCFYWSKCCYHRNRRSSQTNCWDLGITSLICRSAWPAARQALQVEITTTANTDLGLVTLQLGGETRLRPSLQKRVFYFVFCWKIHPKMLWGWPRPSRSHWILPMTPVVFKTQSHTHRHKHEAHHHHHHHPSISLLVVFNCQLCEKLL